MNKTLEYRGYLAEVEVDFDSGLLLGRVFNTTDVITFESESVTTLEEKFHETIDFYISDCEAHGERPEKPFSGRLLLRLTPEKHREVAMAALKKGTSINNWLNLIVDQELNRSHHEDETHSASAAWEDFAQSAEKRRPVTRKSLCNDFRANILQLAG